MRGANLDWAQVGENVELHCMDVSSGFAATNADALFLDMREPWNCLEQAVAALKPGATLAFAAHHKPGAGFAAWAGKGPFDEIEVSELLIRGWKPLPDRLRPNDRMTAHTGFLVFCRQAQKSATWEARMPKGTRERKQEAAKNSGKMNYRYSFAERGRTVF